MKSTIEHNAAEIRRLHQALHEAARHRSESAQAYDAWLKACEAFRAHYDKLAFPGGLSTALERLAAGDLLTAETAIAFLEQHPYFFRSQYISTALKRHLNKIRLPERLQQRLDIVRAAQRERKLRKSRRA